jgi:hypothetical protein
MGGKAAILAPTVWQAAQDGAPLTLTIWLWFWEEQKLSTWRESEKAVRIIRLVRFV